MQCHVSTYGGFDIFFSINYFSTKIQAKFIIMEYHHIKFLLDILTCHEGIFLLENLLALPYLPAIFNSHFFPILQKISIKTQKDCIQQNFIHDFDYISLCGIMKHWINCRDLNFIGNSFGQ